MYDRIKVEILGRGLKNSILMKASSGGGKDMKLLDFSNAKEI